MKFLFTILLSLWFSYGFAQNLTFTVNFDFNKYTLTDSTVKQMDTFFLYLKGFEVVSVYGHCDSIGSNQYNDWLSNQRVNTVLAYMHKRSMYNETFKAKKGFGKRKPLNDNSTEANRLANRRVEITVKIIRWQDIEADDSTANPLEYKIMDTATHIGSTIVLKNMIFYPSRHHLMPVANPIAQDLLITMLNNPGLVIDIEGHICCQPGPEDGLDFETGTYNLSENRAKFIRDYLVDNGVDPSRVTYRGFGHQFPITPYPEATTEQEDNNRRVEIKIIRR